MNRYISNDGFPCCFPVESSAGKSSSLPGGAGKEAQASDCSGFCGGGAAVFGAGSDFFPLVPGRHSSIPKFAPFAL
jgi:hypothetical protein